MTELSSTEIEPRAYTVPKWELWARYFAAYACMLIALGAAWPLVRAPFAPVLLMILLFGLPMSLYLRANGVTYRGRPINRLMLSSIVMLVTFALSALFLAANMGGFEVFFGGILRVLLMFSAGRSVELMIGVFLIFGVARCLFILSDKDAFLCSVPSFAVLFLLIVVQREPIIVLDFIAWTLMTATLLALDQRYEARRGLSGFVRATVPGQDVKLSIRSLATILAISLSCSIALSYTLAATDSDSRSAFETFLRTVVGGLNRFTGDQNDSSTQEQSASAPQNLIDYRSGPPLPTRTILWKMRAEIWSTTQKPVASNATPTPNDATNNSSGGNSTRRRRTNSPINRAQLVFPSYWRLGSLASYDGSSWSQGVGLSTLRTLAPRNGLHRDRVYYDLRPANEANRRENPLTYVPAKGLSKVIQLLVPATSGTGVVLIPALPSAKFTVRDRDATETVRTNIEGSVAYSATQANREIYVVSDVLPLPQYGLGGNIAGANVEDANAKGAKSDARTRRPTLSLTPGERKIYLQLPKVPDRVLNLARRLSGSAKDDLSRAHNIELALQSLATYTLRPPDLPDNRDATDFFLFDSRRGYCTHFAGALAVLCREIGIPARVLTGFANPERENIDGQETQFMVARSANAHAWTEIWLDNVGWVPLDATPADDRGDNAPTIWGDISDRFSSAIASLWISIQAKKALWSLCVSALVVFALLGLLVSRRWKERSRAWSMARKLFGTRITVGRRATGEKAETPFDVQQDLATRAIIFSTYNKTSRALAKKFRPRASWQTPHDWLLEAESARPDFDLQLLHALTDLHRRAMYNPQLFDEAERATARQVQAKLSKIKFVAPRGATR